MMELLFGALVVTTAGLLMGSIVWPMKLMRTLQFEHWWFLGMLTGLIVIPWTASFIIFPGVLQAICDVPPWFLFLSNAFSISWGIANILCGICFVRIGVALTMAILSGLGVSVASIMPLVFKGSGLFNHAPSITSPAGISVLCAIAVMLTGVVIASLAGFGRNRELIDSEVDNEPDSAANTAVPAEFADFRPAERFISNLEIDKQTQKTSGSFAVGLAMAIIAGITSAGSVLAFVYSQGPIIGRVCTIANGSDITITVSDSENISGDYRVDADGAIVLRNMKEQGRIAVGGISVKAASDLVAAKLGIENSDAHPTVTIDTHNVFAVLPVQAVGLLGGALLNVIYPAYLMTRRKSWGVLLNVKMESALATVIGVQMFLAFALANQGMLLLGSLGASIGAGIQQSMQMVGGQGLGFISGEWRGVHGKPRRQMYWAIAFLIVAAGIMTFSNTLAR